MPEFPSAAAICEAAGNRGVLPPRIRAVTWNATVRGPAFPVATPPGQNYWLHAALAQAPPGSVLMVDAGGDQTAGYWGCLMSTAAVGRGLAGLVIDGAVRDLGDLDRLGFPVFACGVAMRGTGKDRAHGGSVGMAITIGDVAVATGDFVVGDRDGVLAMPRTERERILHAARQREAREAEIIRQLPGAPLHQLLGIDLG